MCSGEAMRHGEVNPAQRCELVVADSLSVGNEKGNYVKSRDSVKTPFLYGLSSCSSFEDCSNIEQNTFGLSRMFEDLRTASFS